MLKVSVEHIMTEELVTLNEDATVKQAAHILLRFRINGVLIVSKNNKNRILGVVTTTDLLGLLDKALSQRHRIEALNKLGNIPIKKIANRTILSIPKDTKIERVIAIMHKKRKHTLPVFDRGKLVGVIGKHDVLNAAFG